MGEVRVKLQLNSIKQLIRDKGLSEDGEVQIFHTANVLRRIEKYLPMDSSILLKSTITNTDIQKPEIVSATPYVRYLYYGKVMAGKPPKIVTGKDLQFSLEKHPQAGPFWDRALIANEEDAMMEDLQEYIHRRENK